jgi:hypothetical protein
MKILVVSPDLPYPPNHGGRVDIWNRIRLLSELNHEVDLVVTTNESTLNIEDESEFRRHVKNVFFFPRKIKPLHFFRGTPYQVSSRLQLKNFQTTNEYDYVILESEANSPILDSPSIKKAKILLRIHNNESQYYKSLFKSTKNILKKTYYLYESLAYYNHSKKIKSRADAILHISSDELSAEPKENKVKSFFLPPYINLSTLKKINNSDQEKVLFIGNLFTENNISGLQWYIDSVHPKLARTNEKYELVIAGNTRGKKFPVKNTNQDNIKIIDSPKTLDELYENASIFIIPLLEGAGVKLRAVNAISEGIAIVATSTGIEGLELEDREHYLLGDSSEMFCLAINELLASKPKRTRLAENAQRHMIENLDSKKVLFKILQQMERTNTF